jgi:ATP-dependent Clp protease ATP-binding subunit ClpA
MFERLSEDMKHTVREAREIARDERADSVEVEHLLLAVARHPDARTGPVLAQLGLTEESVRAGLDRELVSALQAVGVAAPAGGRAGFRRAGSAPRFGQSAKLAIVRTMERAQERGDREIGHRHLMLAIASAEAGVVPRLLAELDLTRARVEAAFA